MFAFILGNLHFTYLKESDILSGEYKIYKVEVFNSIKDNTAGGSYAEIMKTAGEVLRNYTIDVWAFCSSIRQQMVCVYVFTYILLGIQVLSILVRLLAYAKLQTLSNWVYYLCSS